MKNFSEFSLSPILMGNLAQQKFEAPTPVQAEAIPPALEGRDVVATAQTGTGKTLAFVLPLLSSLTKEPLSIGIRALVLCPTRELAIQINEVFAKMAAGTGIRAAVVVGGLNEQTQLHTIRKGAQVLIATPGRLCDFLNRKLVKLSGVQTLVIDEADRMLDMGFLPSLQIILSSVGADRQTLFFSATIETSVAHLINTYLKDPVRVKIGPTTQPCENVDLHVYEVEQDRKLGLLNFMLANEQGSFLVFARTKHGVERLAQKLANGGIKAVSIHGGRTQNQRNQALRGFQQGYYRVLVATDVAARGIHVEGIAHVVNFDMPQVPEDFIHRVGRTARAGARGTATTFATRGERGDIHKIERLISMKLAKQPLAPDIPREEKKAASVIVMPFGKTQAHAPQRGAGAPQGRRKVRAAR